MKELNYLKIDEVKELQLNPYNRGIENAHVNKLKKELEDKKQFTNPITVNINTNNIIDGQHRRQAFINAVNENLIPADSTLPVLFIECNSINDEINSIQSCQIQKSWSIDTFVDCYIKQGNVSYQNLRKFCIDHSNICYGAKPNYRYAYSIITGKSNTSTKELQFGTFECTNKDLNNADEVCKEIETLWFLLYDKVEPQIESFIIAYISNKNQLIFDQWIKLFKNARMQTKILKMRRNKEKWSDIFAVLLAEVTKGTIIKSPTFRCPKLDLDNADGMLMDKESTLFGN